MPSLVGATLRTLLFDHWVRDFLRRHPDGTVVELGTGLNTRYERVADGRAHWFDVDLPDVIELRPAFFADGERRRMLHECRVPHPTSEAAGQNDSLARPCGGAGGTRTHGRRMMSPFGILAALADQRSFLTFSQVKWSASCR
ncbi:class I SAM-dependent methyltransferase [Streptomyces sp. 8N706]|uniref:class I SAM-dependent methyltransferase n=1 Tax=Streptomyces sp. 8N706 TaxID=3457416 RepID=UPI003FD2E48A